MSSAILQICVQALRLATLISIWRYLHVFGHLGDMFSSFLDFEIAVSLRIRPSWTYVLRLCDSQPCSRYRSKYLNVFGHLRDMLSSFDARNLKRASRSNAKTGFSRFLPRGFQGLKMTISLAMSSQNRPMAMSARSCDAVFF